MTETIYKLINGIRRRAPEDYISKSVGFDFPLGYGKYKDDVDNFFKQIYPNESVRKYALQQQSQAISGKKGKDIIYTHTGRGGNGKSILQQLTKVTFGDCNLEIPSTMLTKQNKMDHNKPYTFFTDLEVVEWQQLMNHRMDQL